MTDRPNRPTIRVTDPKALRAMAHPIRLSLIGVLRPEGPLTATQAGELIGESSASCSFHLRQLAKYGLVEEAGGGKGRERPWRATTLFTTWPGRRRDPRSRRRPPAQRAWWRSIIRRRSALAGGRADQPEEWQRAAHVRRHDDVRHRRRSS